jgi:hypothetical protein
MDDLPQAERQRGDDEDARGVTESPSHADHPRAAPGPERERRERGEMIGTREHVEEPGEEAGQARGDHGRRSYPSFLETPRNLAAMMSA